RVCPYTTLFRSNPYGEPRLTAEVLARAAGTVYELIYLLSMPLMHGAASYTLFMALFGGCKTILMRRFDAIEALRTIDREKPMIVAVVGDAIARPLADAIRAHG